MPDNSDDKTRTHIVLQQGTMVAHYRIEKKIGAGGMGEVFLAEDTKLKRKVALKFLPVHLVANENIRSRFVREAQILAKLNHPNVVSIYEVSDLDGRPYYSMELVEGESLHDYTHKKHLPIDTVVDYAIQICQGLGEAHRAGIIHRDIKTANIAVDKNHRIRILDFGLAAGHDEDKLTKTGSTLGTVAYMSPEQASGREIDHRSDLFSLGVVLYELITGRTPFKRDSEGATIKAILTDNPEPLSRYKADVPEKLQQIVSELLEKDKEIRYQSAEGVIAGLKRLMYDSQQTTTGRVTTVESEADAKSRKGLWIGISVAAVAIVATAILFMTGDRKSEKPPPKNHMPVIAVKPFENLGAAEDEYFADGMTDEITSRLSGISGIGVISRTSAMKYKKTEKNSREIGAELGADYILTGTVRWSKAGDHPRIRITPQLIESSDDRNVWSDTYDRDLMDVFAVQADIAAKIVGEMGMTLIKRDQDALAAIPTKNAEAYQYYLKALNRFREGKADDTTRNMVDSAVVLDSNFALAFALRSSAYTQNAWHQPHSEHGKIAFQSVERALRLQPDLPQAHLALGFYYHWVQTDYDKAMEQFTIAESRLPNDPDLCRAVAWVYARQAKLDKGIEYARKGVSLDPLNPQMHAALRNYLNVAGHYSEALDEANEVIALEPNEPSSWLDKIYILQSWFGKTDSLIPIALEALKHCDTMAFAKEIWNEREYFPVLPWDSLIEIRKKEILSEDTVSYTDAYVFFRQIGDLTMARVYADSAKDGYLKNLKDEENPYSFTFAGLLLSYLGECQKAVELGKKGKEMLTYDDCFI